MATAGLIEVPPVTLASEPTHEQLETWWEALQTELEDTAVSYTDSFPRTLKTFLARVHLGTYTHFSLLLCAEAVAGAFWLHDTVHVGPQVIGGWIGGNTLPAYRYAGREIWHTIQASLYRHGIPHVFAAVHHANRCSRVYVRQTMGFRRVGVYRRFLRFHGELTDFVVYTMHKEDAELAWTEAHKRARGQRVPELAHASYGDSARVEKVHAA